MPYRDHDSFNWSLDYAARRLAGAFVLAFPGGAAGSHMLRGAWRAACCKPCPLACSARLARLFARRLWRAGGRIGRVALKLVHGIRPALARGGTLDLSTSAYMEAERLCFCTLNRPP